MNKKILFCSLIALFLLIPATSVSSYTEEIEATLSSYYNTSLKKSTSCMDLGDLQFMWGIEEITTDYQTIGCGCNGENFFITGGNNGADPNKVYVFDFEGSYLNSFDQSGTTGWGWLDLAWDGEYFYGGPEASSRIDVFTDDGTIVDTINAPVPWCAGIAYDPDTDHLWVIDKWTDMVFYELDMEGTIINSISQDKNVYGLAWDDLSPGGPYLWAAVQDPQCTFYQFDPATEDYTGVSFEAENPESTDNKACGLGFTTEWNESAGILFAIQQCDQTPDGPGDQLAGYTIYEIGQPIPDICCEGSLAWVDVEPNSTVTGDFQVTNCGEEASLLDWQFESAPSWGVWEIIPDSGEDLAEGDSVTIEVSVIAPDEEETEFTGKIKMINTNDPTDFCEVDVSLVTPKNKAFGLNSNLINWLLNNIPNVFPFLKYFLG
jgi:hypothetical protein